MEAAQGRPEARSPAAALAALVPPAQRPVAGASVGDYLDTAERLQHEAFEAFCRGEEERQYVLLLELIRCARRQRQRPQGCKPNVP
jgi:hypothetical protein